MYKWLVASIAIALIAVGCGTVARNETSPSPQNNGTVRAQQDEPVRKEIKNSNEVALHLEQLARGVQGVTNAHCVIFGNTAVVGIDVDSTLDRSRVGTIKYSVAEAFHKDPYGVDAIVTADIDLAQRLNEIGADIRQGRPITGFAEEMSDIMGRIIPQFPREVLPQQPEANQAPNNMNRR